MYQFSVYNFSEQEIEQIVTIVKRWAQGDIWKAIDARKFTKQVREYGVNWDLLEKRNGRWYITGSSYRNLSHAEFTPRYNLPIEALWQLVEPMLRTDGTTGYSIVNNKLWSDHFGLCVQNEKWASDRDLREKEDILIALSSHHYINFQMAGSTWSIYREAQMVA